MFGRLKVDCLKENVLPYCSVVRVDDEYWLSNVYRLVQYVLEEAIGRKIDLDTRFFLLGYLLHYADFDVETGKLSCVGTMVETPVAVRLRGVDRIQEELDACPKDNVAFVNYFLKKFSLADFEIGRVDVQRSRDGDVISSLKIRTSSNTSYKVFGFSEDSYWFEAFVK